MRTLNARDFQLIQALARDRYVQMAPAVRIHGQDRDLTETERIGLSYCDAFANWAGVAYEIDLVHADAQPETEPSDWEAPEEEKP